MGNKILTLFDMEFKRIQKIFFTAISILIFGNIVVFGACMKTIINHVNKNTGLNQGLEVLKTSLGSNKFLQEQLPSFIYPLSYMLMVLALIGCAFYAVLIWHRDFSSKSKSIYTLFMLPQNRFVIFISKLMTILVLIYSVIFIQHLLWGIEAFIVSKYSGIPIINMIYSINNINGVGIFEIIVPIYPTEFFMIFILGPIVAVTCIFTAVIMSKTKWKIGSTLGVVYIVSLGMVYLTIIIKSYDYSDGILRNNIIFFLVSFLVSICISYILLNKKIYD